MSFSRELQLDSQGWLYLQHFVSKKVMDIYYFESAVDIDDASYAYLLKIFVGSQLSHTPLYQATVLPRPVSSPNSVR